ncbi:MAG: type II secretion system F family protein [Alphaproteobacteria bacterium]
MSWLDNLPFGLTPEQVIILLALCSALLTVMAFWSALVQRNPLASKARQLVERRLMLKAEAAGGRTQTADKAVSVMRDVVTRLNLLRSQHADRMSKKLARAGWRSHDAMVAYLFAKATLPIGAALIMALLLLFGDIGGGLQSRQLIIAGGVVLLCAYLPDIFVKNAADKRRKKLRKALPDGLDLMVICAEAGLSLDASMQRVASEFGRSQPEYADEMALTSVELGFMPERRQALDNLSARTDLPGMRGMVNTLLQTEKYGTPLAQSLRVLAAELRHERLMKAEEKAARLPAMLTVPMILFIMPPLFVILLGPAGLSVVDGLKGIGFGGQ